MSVSFIVDAVWGWQWDKLANIATTIGVPVLIWYTWETLRLRRAASKQLAVSQKQLDAHVRPIVVLHLSIDYPGPGRAYHFREASLENVGYGPAFDVVVEAINCGSRQVTDPTNGTISQVFVQLEVERVPILRAGNAAPASITVLADGIKNGMSIMPSRIANEIVIAVVENKPLLVSVTYYCANGQMHKTEFKIAMDETAPVVWAVPIQLLSEADKN